MFAVKTELVRELLKDKEWTRKLEDAKTEEEVKKVLGDFSKERGYKVEKI